MTFNEFLSSNEARYRLARTIVQGVIGVLIANLDLIIGLTPIPIALRPLIVALVMAILSPIMAMIGGRAPEIQQGYNIDSMAELYEEEEGENDGYDCQN